MGKITNRLSRGWNATKNAFRADRGKYQRQEGARDFSDEAPPTGTPQPSPGFVPSLSTPSRRNPNLPGETSEQHVSRLASLASPDLSLVAPSNLVDVAPNTNIDGAPIIHVDVSSEVLKYLFKENPPQNPTPRYIREHLAEYRNNSQVRDRINADVEKDRGRYKCTVGTDTHHVDLWGVCMVLSGVYDDKYLFSHMATRKSPDAVKDLRKKYGENYVKSSVLVHAIFQAAAIALNVHGHQSNAALCGRELALTALRHAENRRKPSALSGKSWEKHCAPFFDELKQGYLDAESRGNTAEKNLYGRGLAQRAAGVSAIIEGAFIKHYADIDAKDEARQTAAKATSSAIILGIGFGLSFASHNPAPVVASLPILDAVNNRIIQRVLPTHHHAKHLHDIKISRGAAESALDVASVQDKGGVVRAPTSDERSVMNDTLSTYKKAEDHIWEIFGANP